MQKLVVFGGAGMVGSRFTQLNTNKFDIVAPTIEEFDLLDFNKVKDFLKQQKPETIINFAAITNVEGSEEEKGDESGLTYRVNAIVPKNLAEISKDAGTHLVHISTEYVFDGEKSEGPYTEEDSPNPINWYGQTKFDAEKFVEKSGCSNTIFRIAMPYSAQHNLKSDIARTFLDKLRNGQQIQAISDSDVTPIFVDDIASALVKVVEKKSQGIIHVVSTNSTTPFKLAKLIAQSFGLDESLVKEISFDKYNKNKKAKLLRHSWLSTDKFIKEFGEGILHSVEEGIELFKKLS